MSLREILLISPVMFSMIKEHFIKECFQEGLEAIQDAEISELSLFDIFSGRKNVA